MIHVVICDNKDNELKKLINKDRTILIRGNNSRKLPHSRIFVNDELYFINKGDKEIKYHAIVKNAESYSKLPSDDIEKIFNKYDSELNLSDKEKSKWMKKCICVIEFNDFKEIEKFNIRNYSQLEDWITVDSLDKIIGD